MKRILLTLALGSFTLAAQAAPAHDSAASAYTFSTNLQAGPITDLNTATAAVTDPLISGISAGKSVWFKLPRQVHSPELTLTVDVLSSTGVGVACLYEQRDPENPLTSLEQKGSPSSFTAGQTVRLSIQLSDSDDTHVLLMVAGAGKFHVIQRTARVANDFPSTAEVLPDGTRGTVAGTTQYASISADEPAQPVGKEGHNLVWYRWTPSFSGAAALDTNFSYEQGPPIGAFHTARLHSTTLALYQETAPGVLQFVAAHDFTGYQGAGRITFNAVSGSNYLIAVGSVFSSSTGQFQLNYYRANTGGELFYLNANPVTLGERFEDTGSVTIYVARRYAGAFAVNNVNLATDPADSTATAGSDYTALNATLNFPAPASSANEAWLQFATLTLLNNSATESIEHVGLKISNVPIIALISDPTTLLYILDDDNASTPNYDEVIADTPVVRVSESAYSIYTKFLRSNPGGKFDMVLQVDSDSSAKVQDDFTFNTHQQFPAGLTSYNFEVRITNDTVFEPEEQVTFYLPGLSTYKVIIEDDDAFVPNAGLLCANLSYGARRMLCYAAISSTGSVTGKLNLVGSAVSFTTKLDLRGKAITMIHVPGREPMVLSIEARDANGHFRLSLSDLRSGTQFTENFAYLQNYHAKLNPCPEAGRYTFSTASDGRAVVATASVTTAGVAALTGRTFDGAAFTTTGYVDGNGELQAMTSLYGGLGYADFTGVLPLENGSAGNVYCNFFRPTRAGDATKIGIVRLQDKSCYTLRYTPPAAGQRALDSWSTGNGKATFSGGPLMNAITNALKISTASAITPTVSPAKIKITLASGTGFFSGSFVLPTNGKVTPFYGVLHDIPGAGHASGLFFDGLKIGRVDLGAP